MYECVNNITETYCLLVSILLFQPHLLICTYYFHYERKQIKWNTAYPGRGDDKTQHTLEEEMTKHSLPWKRRWQNTAYPGRGDDKTQHTLEEEMTKHSIPWMCRWKNIAYPGRADDFPEVDVHPIVTAHQMSIVCLSILQLHQLITTRAPNDNKNIKW